jgi:diguanylate cyclase (GGDEF)-like protein
VLATLVLTKLVIMPQILLSTEAATAESYFCIISIIIITLALKLSLIAVTLICLSAAVLSLFLCYTALAVSPDLGDIFYYFGDTTAVCLFVAMLREQQEVKHFYQAIVIARDTREKESLNRELSRLAHQDALSGLANRRHFDQVLGSEWYRLARERRPLAVLFIDIDHFKLFNDRYGHGPGDECLRRVSSALSRSLRRPGDLAARYGGEEFVILLPGTDEKGATDVAERVLGEIDSLKIPHYASENGFLTASIGLALTTPDPTLPPESLLQLADAALYKAKSLGRHQLVLAGEIDSNAQPEAI